MTVVFAMRSLHERVERSANAWLKKFALNGEFKDVKALKVMNS